MARTKTTMSSRSLRHMDKNTSRKGSFSFTDVNKDRLYVTLHARSGKSKTAGGEDKYHWALLVGPKIETLNERGIHFHARHVMRTGGSEWIFQEKPTGLNSSDAILVRIMVGKVLKRDRLQEILRTVPLLHDDPDFNSVTWVKAALAKLDVSDGVLSTRYVRWSTVRETAMWYVQKKEDEHRFDGMVRFEEVKPATWDMIYANELNS